MTNPQAAVSARAAVPGVVPIRVQRRSSEASVSGEGLRVLMGSGVRAELLRHGRCQPRGEVCGVLVGELGRDERGPLLRVESVVRGESGVNLSPRAILGSQTWLRVKALLDSRLRGKRVIGWYHGRAGGATPCSIDLAVHESFFATDGLIALFFDPLTERDSLFVRRQGRLVAQAYMIEDAEGARPRRMSRAAAWMTACTFALILISLALPAETYRRMRAAQRPVAPMAVTPAKLLEVPLPNVSAPAVAPIPEPSAPAAPASPQVIANRPEQRGTQIIEMSSE